VFLFQVPGNEARHVHVELSKLTGTHCMHLNVALHYLQHKQHFHLQKAHFQFYPKPILVIAKVFSMSMFCGTPFVNIRTR